MATVIFNKTVTFKKTVDRILAECTELGIRVDLHPLADYPNSMFPNPKVLRHMQLVADATDDGGRCHPHFSRNQNNNRISSREPNILVLTRDARSMIVPDEDHVMLEAFFKFAELRALQMLSQDQDYLEMISQPDPHQYMADKLGISRTYAKLTAYRAPYWGMFKDNDKLVPRPPVEDYFDCFPKFRDWIASTSASNACRQAQRLVASALDDIMPEVEFALRGTGARVLFPYVDGLILTCPKDLEVAVKDHLATVMQPNLINAAITVDSGDSLRAV